MKIKELNREKVGSVMNRRGFDVGYPLNSQSSITIMPASVNEEVDICEMELDIIEGEYHITRITPEVAYMSKDEVNHLFETMNKVDAILNEETSKEDWSKRLRARHKIIQLIYDTFPNLMVGSLSENDMYDISIVIPDAEVNNILEEK